MKNRTWCFPRQGMTERSCLRHGDSGTPGGAAPRAPGRGCRGILAAVCLLGAGAVSATHSQTFFAEPYSGSKVQQYEIDLPVTQDTRRTFDIPGDCPDAMVALASGAVKWGNQIERRVWHKVGDDCGYYAFLHRFPPSVTNDHVTAYDFRNAPLADLLPDSCRITVEEQRALTCGPGVNGRAEILGFLELADGQAGIADFSADACRITAGSFRGQVAVVDGGLRCRPDRRASGFRIMSVNYSDVNGDGYLDAVLRIVPLGSGASRMPIVLAYSRATPDGAFMVPVDGNQGNPDQGSAGNE